ncbi:MAG: hypothetical protein RL748_2403, partial [Pseudomonadota bacterium]
MSAIEPQIAWRRYVLAALVLLSTWWAMQLLGADLGKLLDRDGLGNAMSIVSGFAHPDLSAEFLRRIFDLSLESLF